MALVAGGVIRRCPADRHGTDPAKDTCQIASQPTPHQHPRPAQVSTIIGVLGAIATVSLALGVFALFHQLMGEGRGMLH